MTGLRSKMSPPASSNPCAQPGASAHSRRCRRCLRNGARQSKTSNPGCQAGSRANRACLGNRRHFAQRTPRRSPGLRQAWPLHKARPAPACRNQSRPPQPPGGSRSRHPRRTPTAWVPSSVPNCRTRSWSSSSESGVMSPEERPLAPAPHVSASTRQTRWPRARSVLAHISPIMPPPTTTTSASHRTPRAVVAVLLFGQTRKPRRRGCVASIAALHFPRARRGSRDPSARTDLPWTSALAIARRPGLRLRVSRRESPAVASRRVGRSSRRCRRCRLSARSAWPCGPTRQWKTGRCRRPISLSSPAGVWAWRRRTTRRTAMHPAAHS